MAMSRKYQVYLQSSSADKGRAVILMEVDTVRTSVLAILEHLWAWELL